MALRCCNSYLLTYLLQSVNPQSLLGCTHGVQMILLHDSHLLTDLIKGANSAGIFGVAYLLPQKHAWNNSCHHSQMPPYPAYCNHTLVDDCNMEKTVWKICDFIFTVPLGSKLSPRHHFEPLLWDIFFPLSHHRPWCLHGTALLDNVAS